MESLRFLAGQPVSPERARVFLAAFAAGGFALFASTWKLWTPQGVYPQVAVLAPFGSMPTVVEWVACALVFVSLLLVGVVAFAARRISSEGNGATRSFALIAFALSAILLFLIDQHRFQPWAYQLVIFAIVLATLPMERAFALSRWIVVSIYFWSAVAKLDFSFLNSQGQQFLAAGLSLPGLSLLGTSAADWSPAMRHLAALSFPLAELVIAIGFCLPLHRWMYARRVVLTLAIGMHVLLILLLSPLGLNHQPAVSLWNVWFIAQAMLLFGFPKTGRTITAGQAITAERTILPGGGSAGDAERAGVASPPVPSPLWRELAGVVAEFLVAVVIFLPALNLAGRCDHWPAWGLYAPRNPRATLYLQDASCEQLPGSLRKHLSPEKSDEGWRRLRLDLWSLDALGVPIYPQDRYSIGVAEAVLREHALQNDFQIVVESASDRWTGKRSRTTIRSMAELKIYQSRYLLNAMPKLSNVKSLQQRELLRRQFRLQRV